MHCKINATVSTVSCWQIKIKLNTFIDISHLSIWRDWVESSRPFYRIIMDWGQKSFVVFIFLVVHTTLFLKAVRSMCTVYPCVQCTVCTVYSVSCVSKAKSASLSPSYRWQLSWSHLHFLSPNTFQNTSTSKSCHIICHIAWNDFRPSQHFRHSSKSWAISLTLSLLATSSGLKLTFVLDLAQEYQISWSDDLDTSSSSQTFPKSKVNPNRLEALTNAEES